MIKKIKIEGIGVITLNKSKRARHVSIRVKPRTGVMVTVPIGVDYEKAIEFVHKKTDWISRQLERTKKMEGKQTVFTRDMEYSTRSHRLVFSPWQKKKIEVTVYNGIIKIKFPAGMADNNSILQEMIRKGIVEALRREAKKYLPKRVEEFAAKNGFTFNRVSIRNSKTRWGSCSSRNNINLNLHIMRLPEKLADYVILHELTHTVHKNHGKEFWSLLTEITGDGKGLAKKLRTYDIQIF